jgi:putative transposase
MEKVPASKVVTAPEASEMPLPPQIQEALGELVGAAREGLLALSVGVGLGVVHELMEAEVDEVVGPKGLAVMMLDGLEIAECCHVVALGITTEGVKIPLGLWEGSTEDATLARTLLADLVDRGLDPEQAILFVIDGGKALRRAIKDVFGERALVHRCHRHKERNVCDLLPECDRDQVRARIRAAWSLTDPLLAEQRLQLLAGELDRTWPMPPPRCARASTTR